jgi:hypothetical protein
MEVSLYSVLRDKQLRSIFEMDKALLSSAAQQRRWAIVHRFVQVP